MKSSEHVVRTTENDVVILRLDHEARLNALSSDMLRSLAWEIRTASETAGVRGILVTGTGRAFSAGEDLRETRSFVETHGMQALSALFNEITEAVISSPVPCVAAINGYAIGGAAELTLCFDRRIGTPNAKFRFPESAMGFTISNAASMLLPRLVGASKAIDVVLGGELIDAEACLRIGLLDQVVEESALIGSALADIHRWSPAGNAAKLHLELMRPDILAVRAAFRREAEAAQVAWESGLMDAQISRFER